MSSPVRSGSTDIFDASTASALSVCHTTVQEDKKAHQSRLASPSTVMSELLDNSGQERLAPPGKEAVQADQESFLARMMCKGFFFRTAATVPPHYRRLYYLLAGTKGVIAAPREHTQYVVRSLVSRLLRGELFYGAEVLSADIADTQKVCFDLDYSEKGAAFVNESESPGDRLQRNLADATHLLSVLFAVTRPRVRPNNTTTWRTSEPLSSAFHVQVDLDESRCDRESMDEPTQSRPSFLTDVDPMFLLCASDSGGFHLLSPNVCMTILDMLVVVDIAAASTSRYRPSSDRAMPYDTQIYGGGRGGSLRGLGSCKCVGGSTYKPAFRWTLLGGTWSPVYSHRGKISECDFLHACMLLSPEESGLRSIFMEVSDDTIRRGPVVEHEARKEGEITSDPNRTRKRARICAPAATELSVRASTTPRRLQNTRVTCNQLSRMDDPLLSRNLTAQVWAELRDTLMTYGLGVGQRYGELGSRDFLLKMRTSCIEDSDGTIYISPGTNARKLCPLLSSTRSSPQHKSNGGYFRMSPSLQKTRTMQSYYVLEHVCHDDSCVKARKSNQGIAAACRREVSSELYNACLALFRSTG